MGEEAKQEQAKTMEAKPEEKPVAAEAEKEKKKEEEKKEEEPKPPSPCILHVDLHCVGCANKIEKYILKIRGVEGVVMDMAQNQVTLKGIVDPQAVCNIITKKTKRRAKVLSPLPPPEGEPVPQVVSSQVSGATTVELNVNMHCEACAEQLKRKILKMRGVQTATTELAAGKVTVTGTMDPDKLVEYVYRRTKKQARIVAQPVPEPEKKDQPKEGEANPPAEEKKEGDDKEKAPEEEKKGEGENKEAAGGDNGDQEKPGHEDNNTLEEVDVMMSNEEESMKRMIYYYPPPYVIERMPPAPQLFSDENPNACCIT